MGALPATARKKLYDMCPVGEHHPAFTETPAPAEKLSPYLSTTATREEGGFRWGPFCKISLQKLEDQFMLGGPGSFLASAFLVHLWPQFPLPPPLPRILVSIPALPLHTLKCHHATAECHAVSQHLGWRNFFLIHLVLRVLMGHIWESLPVLHRLAGTKTSRAFSRTAPLLPHTLLQTSLSREVRMPLLWEMPCLWPVDQGKWLSSVLLWTNGG